MKIYTVHVPVRRDGQVSSEPDRVRFVRDGFHFWAFLLGPLWMIWNRLWLVLIIYLVVIAALFAGLSALGASSLVQSAVGFLIAVLIGCEAGSLRRWSLRRRWTQAGVVAARDLEEAERRFFESWADRVPSEPVAPTWPPSAPVAPASPDVLGLFPLPQPEPRR
ncbi:DUF2628 domain-containing protein [Rhodoplanes sp. Z2-YC6860]|uniref:DUF2628 domain-containing protein n=1 Tax=Rhodoplanes sp. Z2-YC6860 TaxID=674703 RepID=UPI00078B4529|nr:DUF2628 domain-containing protein [Rhodoplanes sp. Z2-YC6860]AMN38728.1 hypothetical protein RHPLAN_02630 [Rhodoplanes sp. Z2-YC6860]